jgi:hypothetical protein
MSKLIDTAISHFSNREIRSLEIPEWETTIYSKNLTLDDKARWLARANNDGTDYMIYAVILGATDENGDQVFGLEDKVKLRKQVDPDIVAKIANFVLQVETEEDREKN